MSSVQDRHHFISLYLAQLSHASQWYEELLDPSDDVIVLTSVNDQQEHITCIRSIIVEMLGNGLLHVDIEPMTKHRYWKVV